MFWKRWRKDPVDKCADALYAALKVAVAHGGRIRVEDLLATSAAIVGELAIAAAGDFEPRNHAHAPGSRVFSTRVNRLISDDKSFEEAPADSIAGTLRERLPACGFMPSDFPKLSDVFEFFAANIGKSTDWGTVPLSVPDAHRPLVLPLKVAYDMRATVDRSLAPLQGDHSRRLRAAVLALAHALCETRNALHPRTALSLSFQMINGMAKTAPMTDAAMAEIISRAKARSDFSR